MTLVVASATSDIGFMVADTLLSFAFEMKDRASGPVNGKYHALKIQILNDVLAIAFAGDAEPALKLINALHAELSSNPTMRISERLFESYKQLLLATPTNQKPPDCDFLVLQLTRAGRKLARVTQEDISFCERAHIGDDLEYRNMMNLRRRCHPPQTQLVQQPDGTFHTMPLALSAGEIEFEEIARAMEALTHRRQSSSIGAICGNVTRIVDARISGKLEYLQSGEASLSPEEGVSGFSFLASNSNTRGIGIYYRAGKLGYVFVVGDSEPCRKENATTLSAFIKMADEKYGLHLEGATWVD